MTLHRHMIKTELLDLTVSSRLKAADLQNRAAEVVHHQLNPALDQFFTRLGNAECVIRIDKLVVDLGTISEELFEEQFTARTLLEVEAQLVKLIGSARTEVVLPASGRSEETDSGAAKILSSADYDLELFLHFVTTGCLPWWKSPEPQLSIEEMLRQVLKLNPSLLRQHLLPLLTSSRRRKRLVNQFDEELLPALLRNIDESAVRHYLAYYHLLQAAAVAAGVPDRKLQKLFFESVMEQMAEGGATRQEFRDFALLKTVFLEYIRLEPEASRQGLVEHITRSLANKASGGSGNQPMVLLAALVSAGSLLPAGTAAIVRIITSACGQQRYRQIAKLLRTFEPAEVHEPPLKGKEAVQRHEDKTTPAEDGQDNREIANPKASEKKYGNSNFPEGEPVHSQTYPNADRTTDFSDSVAAKGLNADSDRDEKFLPRPLLYEMDDIAVTNAGLVILHPFLKYFFQGLGLLDNAWQFTDPDNAYRAVHLLQYLVTGQQASPEYELPLNKILCGLDLAEPVPEAQELTGEQIGECHNLLQVVLQQWQALKTRKTEALRETFLKRNGVLVKGAQGWILKVERNSFDVLLDKLPWPLSLVSLPWARQLLSVEW